ncbi:MAG: PAS domain S-box protein, partial [Bacteroidia bacterium]|nr:PAS domain S-box protein [Bacteroidia bacterium]
AKLRLALEQKDEELAKFTAAFDFLPKTEDPEVEDPGPKFVFEQLQKQLEERDIEISHFNEELDKLDFDTPETESRIGLPEALRLVQTQLSDKDQLIEELRQEIDGLKASGPSTTPSAPEEVAGEPILNDSDTDWSSISREYTIENIQASAEKNTNMEAEGALLKEGFSELGIEFNRSMKEFLPASVYETLQSLENEGISVSDHKGYFLVFNESLEEMLGYNRAEANDESEISFLERLYPDPNYRAVVGANIAKIPEDGTFDTNMAYVTSKDGQIKHLKVASTSFYFSRNKYYLSYYTPED